MTQLARRALHAFEDPVVLIIAVDDWNDWAGALGGHPQVKAASGSIHLPFREWVNLASSAAHAAARQEMARWLPANDAPDAPESRNFTFEPSTVTWRKKQ